MPSIATGFPVISPNEADTGITYSVTVPGGLTNPALVVFSAHENAGGAVSSITYNGDALTNVGATSASTWSRCECWVIANPAVGTANVVATKASAGGNRWKIVVYVIEDCDQTTIHRTAATANTNGATTLSATVGSVASTDLLLDQLVIDSAGHNPTAGADQTATHATTTIDGGSDVRGSQQAGSAGGAMSWTWTTSAPASLVAAAFIHDDGGGGGAPAPRMLGTLGVGT